MKKETLLYVKDLILDCVILSGILLIISQFHNISLVWILSPFWITLSIIIVEILLVSICGFFSLLKSLFKFNSERKNNAKE